MSKTLKLADYLGKPFDCSCGRTHSTTLEGVTVSAGAMKALPEYVEKYGFKNLYIACDEITYGIAGEKVMNILKDAGIKAKAHVFKGKRFIPDEKALGELMIDADRDCDLVVAVGTGSINDMCRFFSFQMGVPYAIVATAAPMDGFASSGAALIINSMKTTIPAQTPLFIIGDTDILCGAPARMVSAGLGDLLGKFTCLNDWRISKVVNDEYYCDEIVNLVTDCIENVLADADNVASRDPKVIGDIMEGLVLTGVAMSFIGNSRPAAGCEHHMCHFWETLELQEGKIPVLHGTKVAVGTVMILKMTEFLRENRPDFDAAREKAKAYDQAAWEAKINEVYGASASSIIALEHESQKNEVNGRLKRIDAIEAHWDEIVKLMDDNMPTAARMIEILKSLDAPYLPSQIGFDDDRLYNASEPLEERRQKAIELGASAAIDPMNTNAVEEVLKLTNGRGAAVVYNTTASPVLMGQAMEMTAPCGTCVAFSSMHPNKAVPVDAGAMHTLQKTMTGAVSPTINAFYQAYELIDKGLLDPTVLTEKIFDYTDFDAAMECAMRPDTYKVIIKVGEE